MPVAANFEAPTRVRVRRLKRNPVFRWWKDTRGDSNSPVSSFLAQRTHKKTNDSGEDRHELARTTRKSLVSAGQKHTYPTPSLAGTYHALLNNNYKGHYSVLLWVSISKTFCRPDPSIHPAFFAVLGLLAPSLCASAICCFSFNAYICLSTLHTHHPSSSI